MYDKLKADLSIELENWEQSQEELDELKQIIVDSYTAKLPILNLDDPIKLLNKIATKLSSQLQPPVLKKIAEGLMAEFNGYLLSAENCETIKNLKYKTDIDFASLLFRIIAKQIIEKYVSNFS